MRATWKVKQNLEMGRLDGRKEYPVEVSRVSGLWGRGSGDEQVWRKGLGVWLWLRHTRVSKQSVTGKWAGMWSSEQRFVCNGVG